MAIGGRWSFLLLVTLSLALAAPAPRPVSRVTTVVAHAPTQGATSSSCSIAYNLPGDIGAFGSDPPDQEDLDIYSWQLFLALNAPAVGKSVSTTGDNSTLWGASVANPITQSNPGWSSTDDLLLGVTKSSVPPYGTHYYPNACKQIQGYQSYRVVDELDKVDDSFFEAKVGGLSNSPAAAANGTFVRYEILISPVTYGTIATNQWYLTSVLNSLTQPLSFPCGQQSAGGPHASPADQGIGAITIKNAWMDATGVDTSDYHTEKLLVFTSAEENNSGQDTCELKTMALVGMHIAHKTTEQAGWTWSTFEHQANAPNCLNAPPPPDPNRQNAVGANLACPSAGGSYNFFPQNTGDPRFQTCNATPAGNAPTGSSCDDGFCADLAPNATAGYSRLCRQLPLQTNYPTAYQQTQACNAATGKSSVWSNYALVSTQWFTQFSQPVTCQNAASVVKPNGTPGAAAYAPQVAMSDGTTKVPYLANTALESYERSVCMGCHQGAAVPGGNKVSTDLMYFLQLEVAGAPINQGMTSPRTKQ
jgi:hypothetical protein